MSYVLEVRGLEKIYGSTKSNYTHAVAGVSFDVASGEFVAIMGPSGSGKSTLVNCISTIDRPTSGEVRINGQSVSAMKSSQLADFRGHELGFIFQNPNLLDTLTCKENIALPLAINGVDAHSIDGEVTRLAQSLGVGKVLAKFPYEISGGQAQRVAACRALITKPSLVVADEPTGALDSKNSKILLESFTKMNREEGATILMVTHDVYAASWCKRVMFLRDGKLYSELHRGDKDRRQFFEEIMDVLSVIGGGESDVL